MWPPAQGGVESIREVASVRAPGATVLHCTATVRLWLWLCLPARCRPRPFHAACWGPQSVKSRLGAGFGAGLACSEYRNSRVRPRKSTQRTELTAQCTLHTVATAH